MKAVILAGGLGTRLRPFTETIPKPLLPIGEKAVLEIQIERLVKFDFNEIFIATSYKSRYIENFLGDGFRYGATLKISKEEKPLGTAGPLNLIKEELKEPFLVMNGDILTLCDFSKLYKFSLEKNSPLTITIKKRITPFQFGNIFFEGDYVTGIQEKPNIVTYILAGIYVMTPEIFDFIPQNEFFGMDHLINILLRKKVKVTKYELSEYWLDVGNINDYQKAKEAYDQHFKVN